MPAQDASGVGYRDRARDGLYVQAYQAPPALGPGVWGVRWVNTFSRPYSVLPSNEAYAAWLSVQQYEAIRRKGPEAETVVHAEADLQAAGAGRPITPIGVAPPRRANLAAFAWVPQEQIPGFMSLSLSLPASAPSRLCDRPMAGPGLRAERAAPLSVQRDAVAVRAAEILRGREKGLGGRASGAAAGRREH